MTYYLPTLRTAEDAVQEHAGRRVSCVIQRAAFFDGPKIVRELERESFMTLRVEHGHLTRFFRIVVVGIGLLERGGKNLADLVRECEGAKFVKYAPVSSVARTMLDGNDLGVVYFVRQ
jgi:hypothetical protein